MKMRDLVKQTGVSREKIHFFTRENLLPGIKKTSPNQAIYNQKHVERIHLIQNLQDRCYIPIPVIKQIIKQLETSPQGEELLRIKTSYFTPTDHFLPQEIRGEDEFLEFSGLSAGRLADFEKYDIIRPLLENNVKVYRHDSIKLGKLVGDMRKSGISYEKGFGRTDLKEIRDMLVPIIDFSIKTFVEALEKNPLPDEEAQNLSREGIEYTSIFMYHMSHLLFEDAIENYSENDHEEGSKQLEPSDRQREMHRKANG